MSKMPENKPKRRRKSIKGILIVVLILIMIAGAAMVLTPYLEGLEQDRLISQEVDAFKEFVQVYKTDKSEVPDKTGETEPAGESTETEPTESEPVEPVFQELRSVMETYNEEIYKNGQSDLKDAWSYQAEVFDLKEYGYEANAVGIVTIPKISVELPLYLGATYNNLAKGFAQLSQTSMPTGGENTNCVIAAHRGWTGLPYMREVQQLELGDSVFVENPWETLEYRVCDIIIIEPHEIETILIQDGRDLLTVVTCHPYGVGSHRYVLICERYISASEENSPVTEPTTALEINEAEATQPAETIGEWVEELQDRVTIRTNNNEDFKPSQIIVFVTEYLPWICLSLASVLLVCIGIGAVVYRLRRKK